jgi:hypothetical protein
MKPPAFARHACRTVTGAVGLLDSFQDADVISGGLSQATPETLRKVVHDA